jgi:hypothetical protein
MATSYVVLRLNVGTARVRGSEGDAKLLLVIPKVIAFLARQHYGFRAYASMLFLFFSLAQVLNIDSEVNLANVREKEAAACIL